jgi:hypothetical protein
MKISRIESILYGVENLEAGLRFYEDWGLACIGRGANGADFALPSGQMIFVRRIDDPGLPPAIEPGSTAREITWGVDDPESIQEIAGELSRDRKVWADPEDAIHTYDPNRAAIAFRVMRPALSATTPRLAPTGGAVPPIAPARLAHVVFTVTSEMGRPTSDFYVERLQFRISDRVLDNGDFLRAPGAIDHHNLFIQHRVNSLSFNHAAFQMDSFEDVMRAGEYMRSRSWTTAIEPGSHFVSAQKYWYFKNPCGGEAEYYSTDRIVDDSWQTRVWETARRVPTSH